MKRLEVSRHEAAPETGFRVLAEYSDFKRSKPRYGAEQVWIAETD